MEVDFTRLSAADRYWYLCSFVGPRPIALVTTVSSSGVRNAAPMSFFNVVSHDPPILVLGVQRRRDGSLKDTARNISQVREFVVNMVDMSIARPMVNCAVDHPSEVDEVEESGLEWVSSTAVAPGRIAQSPCSFECRLERSIEYSGRSVYLGEVVHVHVHDELLGADGLSLVEGRYRPIARLHGDNYIEAADQFVLRHDRDLPIG